MWLLQQTGPPLSSWKEAARADRKHERNMDKIEIELLVKLSNRKCFTLYFHHSPGVSAKKGSGFLLCQSMTGMKYSPAWKAAPSPCGFSKEPSSKEVP